MALTNSLVSEEVLLRSAEVVIRRCLDLKQGQTFLLISDETTPEFPALFRYAAIACNIEFEHFFVAQDAQEQPAVAFTPELMRAIGRAQGILVATSGAVRCSGFRITLITDRRGAGCRVATMPGADLEILRAVDIDYEEIFESALQLTLPLLKGESCMITTYGKDGAEHQLRMSLGGALRVPIQSLGVIPADAWGNIPGGEIFIAPIENSAEGEFLSNGAVSHEKLTDGREALFSFEGGRLVRHRYVGTRREVRALIDARRIAESQGDGECWRVIAELGIGLNQKISRITGIPVADEKMYGTAHIAVGHNTGYGGRNICRSLHCDITTIGPTLVIDGVQVMERGRHVLDPRWLDSYRRFLSLERRSGSDLIEINPQSFVSRDGLLLLRQITASGRETLYPFGDHESSELAHRLIDGAVEDMLDVTAAPARLGLQRETIDALIAMLSAHGVIHQ